MPTDGVDTDPIEDNIPFTEIDATSKHNDKTTLQPLRYKTTAYVDEHNQNLQKGAAYALTI